MLTDGAPTDSVCPDLFPRIDTTTVDIVIIGIGPETDWMDQISCLGVAASMPSLTVAAEFDSGSFNELEGFVRDYTCNGLNAAGPGDRGGDAWIYDDGSTGSAPTAEPSPAPTSMSKFVVSDESMGWNDAYDWCNDQGYVMVSIHSDEENAAALAMCTDCWIGLHCQNSDAHCNDSYFDWMWTNGDGVDEYANWKEGEPDNEGGKAFPDGELCVQMEPSGKWNDRECELQFRALCDK